MLSSIKLLNTFQFQISQKTFVATMAHKSNCLFFNFQSSNKRLRKLCTLAQSSPTRDIDKAIKCWNYLFIVFLNINQYGKYSHFYILAYMIHINFECSAFDPVEFPAFMHLFQKYVHPFHYLHLRKMKTTLTFSCSYFELGTHDVYSRIIRQFQIINTCHHRW